MPPQIEALLQDKRMLAIIGGVLLVLIILGIVLGVKGSAKKDPMEAFLGSEQKVLASINGYGKAIEIQALLARQGIQMNQDDKEGESKIRLVFSDDAREKDRDKALITLVQSGLMDKNVGLEAFDKGDLTASREEKRIKLIRAQEGELTRLIKKIDPIEDASVDIAIPEQTLFRSEEKPMSASVQVTLPTGSRLTRDKVRAISNLMVGSLQGLEANHVSISDTSGNTYSSVLDPGAEMDTKLEEQDGYMKQKVMTQLDHLVGAGNYVVTVSTELREAPRETMVQEYDPNHGAVSSKQSFNENLNSGTSEVSPGGPVSTILPDKLNHPLIGNLATLGKDYLRNGMEVSYNNSRTQWMENSPVGMVEDISIAVTIDNSHFPETMSVGDLQTLIARSASPKVRPKNVSIARSGSVTPPPVNGSENNNNNNSEPPADLSWLYWTGGVVGLCVILLMLLNMRKENGALQQQDDSLRQTQQELHQLKEMAYQQQSQIQAAQQQAQETQQHTQRLIEATNQIMSAPSMQKSEQQQIQQSSSQQNEMTSNQSSHSETPHQETPLSVESLENQLRREWADQDDDLDDEQLDQQIRSWIESSP